MDTIFSTQTGGNYEKAKKILVFDCDLELQ